MSGFVLTSYPRNPDPDHIAQVAWEFMCELLAMEPGSKNGGIYTDKAGYHNTRKRLLTAKDAHGNLRWPNDYSVRLPADKQGPDNYSAAFDWTLGTEEKMRKYGNRIRAAFNARDPRLNGWREALGQGDPDPQADGWDFVFWTTRNPDASHEWHWHLSILRQFILMRLIYANMLSLLRGETLEEWRDGVSKEDVKEFYDWLIGGAGVSDPAQRKWRDEKFIPFMRLDTLDTLESKVTGLEETVTDTATDVQTLTDGVNAIKADVTTIKDTISNLPSQPIPEIDYDKLAKALLRAIAGNGGDPVT